MGVIRIKKNGNWAPVRSLYRKHSGAWSRVQKAFVKKDGEWFQVYPAPAGLLNVSDGSLTFSTYQNYSSASQTIQLTNNGTADLIINYI